MMTQSPSPQNAQTSLYWVTAAFLVFALLLLLVPLPFQSPVTEARAVPARFTDPTPLRQPRLLPEYQAGVFEYRCNDCHRIIPPPIRGGTHSAIQHKEIQLEHGINTVCLNCHHRTNRNMFTDSSGGEIPWDQPQLLCAQCHGPVYRDWQHGSHGRTNGYWNTDLGNRIRRKCIECHDPHRPPFPAMQSAPGPHTLRQGKQRWDDHSTTHNPLRLGAPHSRSEPPDASNEGH